MDANILYISLIGFFICFILLFYFISRYKEFFGGEEESFNTHFEKEEIDSKAFSKISINPKLEKDIVELRDQIKHFNHQMEELKLVQEEKNKEFVKNISDVEKRVTTFEEEYINKLQPAIASLVDELEMLGDQQQAIQEQADEKEQANSNSEKPLKPQAEQIDEI